MEFNIYLYKAENCRMYVQTLPYLSNFSLRNFRLKHFQKGKTNEGAKFLKDA